MGAQWRARARCRRAAPAWGSVVAGVFDAASSVAYALARVAWATRRPGREAGPYAAYRDTAALKARLEGWVRASEEGAA